MSAAPKTPTILASRIRQTIANGLEELTHILVVNAGESEENIVREIGWSPLEHPIDGYRHDDSRFEPYWDWLKDHGGWFELIHSIGTDYAYILLIEDAGNSDLVRMCHCDQGNLAHQAQRSVFQSDSMPSLAPQSPLMS